MNRNEHFDKTLWCQNRKKTSYWLDGLPEFNDVNNLPPSQVDVAIVIHPSKKCFVSLCDGTA